MGEGCECQLLQQRDFSNGLGATAAAGTFARPMGNEGITSEPRLGIVNNAFRHAETTGYFQRAHASAKHADDIRNDDDVLAGCDAHAARPVLSDAVKSSARMTPPDACRIGRRHRCGTEPR